MSLLSSSVPDRYQASRPVTRRDRHGVPPKWRFVIELHLAGHQPTRTQYDEVIEDGRLVKKVKRLSIKELTGYSPATIHKILASEEAVALKQQIMSYYDSEFEVLYPQVIDAVRRGLDSDDKYLDAAKLYLKAFGKQSSGQQGASISLTAEDVVFNILNQTGREASVVQPETMQKGPKLIPQSSRSSVEDEEDDDDA